MTYTVKDIMARFGVEQHTVLHWIHTGQLNAINVGTDPGKKKPRWRVGEEALAAFEKVRTHSPPPPRTRRKKQPADVVDYY